MKAHSIMSALRHRRVQMLGIAVAAVLSVPMVVAYRKDSAPIGVFTARAASIAIAPAPDAGSATPRPGEWDLANIDNARVDSWVGRFTSDLRSSMAVYLDRMSRYDDMITSKLAEREMPKELIFLAMIESGFNPKAKSPVSASGLWQFMGATGRQYGLVVNRRVDERNDPAKATDAALSYLSDLYGKFGSWYLAFAAYNSGEGRVARVMRTRLGRTSGTDSDFYRIAGGLPQETRDYVPKLIAAARIAKEPAKYGFDAAS